jgi:formate dehydrogenase maturation protein FdhE
MVGTQSLQQLNDYYENGSQQDPKAMEELKKKAGKHLINVDGTLQNHYMHQKSIKYHLIVLAALELFSTAQLQQIMRKPLLTVSRLPLTDGQAPKTLSDLHYHNPVIVTKQD